MLIAGVMGCCMLGPFINILDTNVVNVALPRMMSGLGTDILTIRWVVTAYLIATAVTMPAIGWIGRRLGNQRLYAMGLSVFTGASALCGIAPSVEFLILFRILQGLGAGVLMPISWALMIQIAPPEQRGMATSIWAIGASLGSLAGLPIGGYFADAVDWRAVFYVNFIPGSLAVLGTILLVPVSEREDRVPFDGWGFLTLSIALVSLLVALSQVQQEGWDAPLILTLLALCGLAIPVFLLIEHYSSNPLIDLQLYRSVLYASGTIVTLVMGVFFYASSFLIILFAQLVLDHSVQQSALMLVPGSIAMIMAAYTAGWLVDRFEPRLAMLLGLFGFCACCSDDPCGSPYYWRLYRLGLYLARIWSGVSQCSRVCCGHQWLGPAPCPYGIKSFEPMPGVGWHVRNLAFGHADGALANYSSGAFCRGANAHLHRHAASTRYLHPDGAKVGTRPWCGRMVRSWSPLRTPGTRGTRARAQRLFRFCIDSGRVFGGICLDDAHGAAASTLMPIISRLVKRDDFGI